MSLLYTLQSVATLCTPPPPPCLPLHSCPAMFEGSLCIAAWSLSASPSTVHAVLCAMHYAAQNRRAGTLCLKHAHTHNTTKARLLSALCPPPFPPSPPHTHTRPFPCAAYPLICWIQPGCSTTKQGSYRNCTRRAGWEAAAAAAGLQCQQRGPRNGGQQRVAQPWHTALAALPLLGWALLQRVSCWHCTTSVGM